MNEANAAEGILLIHVQEKFLFGLDSRPTARMYTVVISCDIGRFVSTFTLSFVG